MLLPINYCRIHIQNNEPYFVHTYPSPAFFAIILGKENSNLESDLLLFDKPSNIFIDFYNASSIQINPVLCWCHKCHFDVYCCFLKSIVMRQSSFAAH